MPAQDATDRIVFEVEMERDAEPISGLLRLGDRELEFAGWVALAGALEQILKSEETNDRKEAVQ